MKRLTLLMLCSFFSYIAKAQIEKGRIFLGGAISYSSKQEEFETYPGWKSTSFKLNPNVGYFVLNQLVGGIRINGSTTKHLNIGSTRAEASDVTMGPFARFYFLENGKVLNFFTDVSYLFGRSKTYQEYNSPSSPQSSTSKSKMKEYSITAGPSFFLNKHMALELSFSYVRKSTDLNSRSKEMMIGLGIQTFL